MLYWLNFKKACKKISFVKQLLLPWESENFQLF